MPRAHLPKDGKLSVAQRRAHLTLACEYDRLQIRLACARLDAGQKQSHNGMAARARAFFQQFPPADLVRISALLMPRKYRAVVVLLGTLRRLWRHKVR